jgi:ABC-2 type transport system ATP-binding protein
MAAVIKTEGLTRRYGRQTAVDALSFEVNAGEVFGFLGPNGAGKTTTILMLLGLTEPTAGRAEVLGCDPARHPLEIKRQVGYLPENVGFYDELTARENLRFVARLNQIPETKAQTALEAALNTVGLAGEGDKLVGQCSRGMRQRLGIAELLIKEPKLVILDEPALGLDPDGMNKMLDLIVSLNRERGITVLMCTHMLNHVERICGRVGIMFKGKLVALGTIPELALSRSGRALSPTSLEQIYLGYCQDDKPC